MEKRIKYNIEVREPADPALPLIGWTRVMTAHTLSRANDIAKVLVDGVGCRIVMETQLVVFTTEVGNESLPDGEGS